ncbi:methyltransferase [Sorangium sp. So ce1335]|uniref:methyltransferase n=1 Tax=Sorangium sp. So ce1335 TaxID=3133335 RepID=UPI003F5E958F
MLDPSMPPPARLFQMINASFITQSVVTVAKLGIADRLKDGPLPVEALAESTGAHAPSLYRVLRALASLGVFSETEQGSFGLTPVGDCLRSDAPGSLRAYALMTGDAWCQHCVIDLSRCVETGTPATTRLYGLDNIFQHFDAEPAAAANFNEAMSSFARQIHSAAVAAYDFSGVRRLVDVGGGHGALLASILSRHPEMRGVLFDLPRVVRDALAGLERAGVAERCEVAGGDFFRAVPEGADAYILSAIVHDWSDDDALVLLRNVRRAIADDGRLLLVESVIMPGDAPDFGKLLDLAMMLVGGGRERTEAEFRALLAAAGFRLTRVLPTASANAVIEALPA